MLKVTCPSCGRSGRVPEQAAGKRAQCPACGHRHQIPEASAPAIDEGLELLDDDPPASARVARPSPTTPRVPKPATPSSPSAEEPVLVPTNSTAPGQVGSRKLIPIFAGISALAGILIVAMLTWLVFKRPQGPAEAPPAAVVVFSNPARTIAPNKPDEAKVVATADRPAEAVIQKTPEPTPAPPPNRPLPAVPTPAPALAPPGRTLSTAEIVAESEGSVALIKGKGSSGTGFLVAPGVLVTNAHVIDSEFIQELEVRFPSAPKADQGPTGAELLYEDAQRDLAFLSITSNLRPLRVAQAFQYRKGEDVTVIGNPGIGDGSGTLLENAINRGVLSTKAELEGQSYYQLGIAVNPGNSGGPVFDSTGQVIGVVTLRIPDKQELAFCIPVEEFRAAQAKLAELSQGETQAVRSRHRLVTAFKNLTTAGALYGFTLELHTAMKMGLKSDELSQIVSKLDQTLPDLEQGQFANLGKEVNLAKSDSLIDVSTRKKLGDLSKNYTSFKAAFKQNRDGIPLDKVRSLKSNHRRLVDDLKSAIDIEVPDKLLALFDDHIVTQAARPTVVVDNFLPSRPGSNFRSRTRTRPIGPPSRIGPSSRLGRLR